MFHPCLSYRRGREKTSVMLLNQDPLDRGRVYWIRWKQSTNSNTAIVCCCDGSFLFKFVPLSQKLCDVPAPICFIFHKFPTVSLPRQSLRYPFRSRSLSLVKLTPGEPKASRACAGTLPSVYPQHVNEVIQGRRGNRCLNSSTNHPKHCLLSWTNLFSFS